MLTGELQGNPTYNKNVIRQGEMGQHVTFLAINRAKRRMRHSRSTSGDVGGPRVRCGFERSKVDQSGSGDLTTGDDGQEVGRGSTSPVQGNGLTLNDGGL